MQSVIRGLLVFAFTSSIFIYGKAQVFQSMQTQQVSNNIVSYFPGFAGWHGGLQVNAAGQSGWSGFEGFPQHALLATDVYLSKIRTGIGISSGYYKIGGRDSKGLELNVNHRFRIGSDIYLMPSLGVGFNQHEYRNNFNPFPYYVDSSHSGYIHKAIKISSSAALVYKRFYGAILYTDNGLASYRSYVGRRYIHAHHEIRTLAAYQFNFRDVIVTPLLFTRNLIGRERDTYQIGINAQRQWLHAGLAYAYNDYILLSAGFEIKSKVRLGYSYAKSTSRIARGSNGTHSIGIRFLFGDPAQRMIQSVPIL